jgi:hypothetical protein
VSPGLILYAPDLCGPSSRHIGLEQRSNDYDGDECSSPEEAIADEAKHASKGRSFQAILDGARQALRSPIPP